MRSVLLFELLTLITLFTVSENWENRIEKNLTAKGFHEICTTV